MKWSTLIVFSLLVIGMVFSEAPISKVLAGTLNESRLEPGDKEEIQKEFNEMLNDYREDHNGQIVMTELWPKVQEVVGNLYDREIIQKEEVFTFKTRYEEIQAKVHLSDDDREKAIQALVTRTLDDIGATPLQCTDSGKVCNEWNRCCTKGAVCVEEPSRGAKFIAGSCAKEGKTCGKNSDCCSKECFEDPKTKKKTCESIKRCVIPIALNKSCFTVPVCKKGSCQAFNNNTNGIGECRGAETKCRKNSECCSNLCDGKKCSPNYICKDCATIGQRPTRKKCCEGLTPQKDRKGRSICAPDAPPLILGPFSDLGGSGFLKKFIAVGVSLLISPVEAQTTEAQAQANCGNGFMSAWCKANVKNQVDQAALTNDKGTQKAVDTINKNAEDYEAGANFKPALDPSINYNQKLSGAVPTMNFAASDWVTCDINFRNDYYRELARKDLLKVEIALLSFEYMALGTGTVDYWTNKAGDSKGKYSVHARAAEVAKSLKDDRKIVQDEVATTDRELKCLCYDYLGYGALDVTKKEYFAKNCKEQYKTLKEQLGSELFEKLQDAEAGSAAAEEANAKMGDVSGVKYQKMLVKLGEVTRKFKEMILTVTGPNLLKLQELSNWLQTEAKWNQAEVKNHDLYNFTIFDFKGTVLGAGAIVGALLAAGVVAVTGGFAATATIGAWGAAGIITASAAAGAGGFWLLGSLRGAWQGKAPEIKDNQQKKPKDMYKCVLYQKNMCSDFKRVLKQPYNKVCKKHTSANACVKSFLITQENELKGENGVRANNLNTNDDAKITVHKKFLEKFADGDGSYYLIDPWIPVGMKKSELIRDTRNYSDLLEKGFNKALSYLKSKKPAMLQKEDYLKHTIIDSAAVGHFAPNLKEGGQYKLTKTMKAKIRKGARKYAVDQGFLMAEEKEHLQAFGEYTYTYHFFWPRAV
ncbi:MAG: glycine zipper family protein, partial [Halobacteriovoraceae bacterium]|nr:glycine zipper family protein [Halobacteriovoraceae bacterium]